ncbi:MAG TPA: regulatory protein RecX [Chitinophagaceae bacterium]|nr:regulatory protein RecX [Chitinophagaceae bacterium]
MATYKKQLSPEQALQKLRHYCGYQERCHREVTDKLYSLGVRKNDQGEIIASLISDGYLNEERYARAFAGGKFRVNGWGRVKIKYALKQKQVSEYCIRKALSEIKEQDYLDKLQKITTEKFASLKGEHYLVRKKKTADFLIQRGFEPNLAEAAISMITKKDE